MTYDEIINYIEGLPPFVPVKREDGRPLFDLETVTDLAARLDNPQDRFKAVHIAGTNGKGSTAEFLSEIMISSGYKTGLFTSPYLKCIREQTKVNSEIISKKDFAEVFSDVIEKAEEMKAEGMNAPSEFEMDVCASFLYFAKCKCDIVIIEAGLGGEFDATNIISDPLLCIFTQISRDHMSVLGESLSEIAGVKAGIIKPGCDCLTVKQEREVSAILEKRAKEKGALIKEAPAPEEVRSDLSGVSFIKKKYGEDVRLVLSVTGAYQALNAALAAEAALILKQNGYPGVTADTIKKGLLNVKRPGRFEVICKDPVIIADGAHNVGGVEALLEGLKQIFPDKYKEGKGFVFVAGVLADKEYDEMIDLVTPHAFKVFTVTPGNVRAMPAKILAEVFEEHGADAIPEDDISTALDKAKQTATEKGIPVVVFGSLYYMGSLNH